MDIIKRELTNILSQIHNVKRYRIFGKVTAIKGILVEVIGLSDFAAIDSRCAIYTRNNNKIIADVVGAEGEILFLLPYNITTNIGVGCEVEFLEASPILYPDHSWRGRVINAFAEPIDGKGKLLQGPVEYHYKQDPIASYKRSLVGEKIDLGVKSMNVFTSCCVGQRMGIFAGSGVGKSVLSAMLTKYADTDIKVIGLIGERGREVQEFLQEQLGEEGLKNAIVIVATSDESPIMRKQAAYLTMTIAEYFRDQNMHVLCIMDSVTRFAMAQREIGLSLGEPPTTKGYTPTVFVELPRLLERAGPGMQGQGSITALFAVLVEGDDTNEPIADAVRGILDGHVVLDRSIAERGRFPAVNLLKSLSRTMPGCNNEYENKIVVRAKRLMAAYTDMEEMIKLGAYRMGSNNEIDEAIKYYPLIEEFLAQSSNFRSEINNDYKTLAELLDMKE